MAKGKKRRRKEQNILRFLSPQAVGLAFILLALFTFFCLLPSEKGPITGTWLRLLRLSFGVGVYLSPLVLGGIGITLLLYGTGRASRKEIQRLASGLIFYFMLLASIHSLVSSQDPRALAAEGGGGGYVGWLIREGLLKALGLLGMAFILVVFMALSLFIAAGFSLPEAIDALEGWGKNLAERYRFWRMRGGSLRSIGEEIASKIAPGRRPVSPPVRPERLAPIPPRIIGIKQRWQLPLISEILEDYSEKEIEEAEIRRKVRIIEETLAGFGIPARVVEVNRGPTVTQFGVEPGYIEKKGPDGRLKRMKVRVSRIKSLANDLALALSASPVRIEAPVPGRSYVGIEVPNSELSLVSLRGVMESEEFQRMDSRLKIALGRDVSGQPVVADLATMPHLLIAGATGSGKSVCINSIVTCLTCINTPETLRLILVDPKRVELVHFNGLPHLVTPVIVDVDKVISALKWTVREMARRYQLFSREGARHIDHYNQMMASKGREILPYLLVVVDELADIMLVAPEEVEGMITRLAQMARATGIHLVIATQRPSVDVITGLIKANFPARISFAVTSQVDSRVVLDSAGAEDLLGRGDMLFMPPDSSHLIRIQGCFVSDREVSRLVRFWRSQGIGEPLPSRPVQEPLSPEFKSILAAKPGKAPPEEDDLLEEAIKVVREYGRASTSLLQRKLRIGYNRAARLIELLEEKGVIGPDEGPGRPRRVIQGR